MLIYISKAYFQTLADFHEISLFKGLETHTNVGRDVQVLQFELYITLFIWIFIINWAVDVEYEGKITAFVFEI
jgi:hypothetical protein